LQPFDLPAKVRDPPLALHAVAPVAQIAAEPVDLDAHFLAAAIAGGAGPRSTCG
jgi:hypothetical protein